MRKNTDLHLKMRTVTVKNFWELPQVLCEVQNKSFCEDTGIHVFGEVFLGFLIGVITWVVH
jgi:hypothetical protein